MYIQEKNIALSMVSGIYWSLGTYSLQIRRNYCTWNKNKNHLTHTPCPCIFSLLCGKRIKQTCCPSPFFPALPMALPCSQSPSTKSKSLNHPVMSSVSHTSVLTHVLPFCLESFFAKMLFILQNPTHASLTPWKLSHHSFLCASCAHQLSH